MYTSIFGCPFRLRFDNGNKANWHGVSGMKRLLKKGITTLIKNSKRAVSIVNNCKGNSSPCYVISHERSGTHFLINTINQNLKVNVGEGFGSPSCGKGWNYVGDWLGPYDSEEKRFQEIERYNRWCWNLAPHSNSIIKTHASRRLFEEKFKSAPVVYIYRDPRDTMVSFYHYLQKCEGLYRAHPWIERIGDISFSDFLRMPLKDYLRKGFFFDEPMVNVIERWAVHVSGWLSDGNICAIRYEDLKTQPQLVMAQVSKHLNVPFLDRQFQEININSSVSMLPRKGVVGDWENYFSEEDLVMTQNVLIQYGLQDHLSNYASP